MIDVRDGLAVHARGGRRDLYQPVGTVGGRPIPRGDAVSLAREYVRLGFDEIYVADLDAIRGEPPRQDLIRDVVTAAARTWIDAGTSSPDAATRIASLGADQIVAGLETLTSFDDLAAIAAALGRAHTAFSLDLRAGSPIAGSVTGLSRQSPAGITRHAADAGAGVIIVLDLARVGADAGVDETLLRDLRAAAPDVVLAAAGGVRGMDDLVRLAALGCDAALVASAVLDSRLTAADIAAAQRLRVSR